MSKEADGYRLVQPRPPPLIPLQSSGLPVYSTSALPTGSSPSVLGGLSAPVHNLPFNFTSGGHTQPSIDTTSMGGRNREATSMIFQVPPVDKYSGDAEIEPFEEWLEQFELVASVCCWEGKTKLANLVTRL